MEITNSEELVKETTQRLDGERAASFLHRSNVFIPNEPSLETIADTLLL